MIEIFSIIGVLVSIAGLTFAIRSRWRRVYTWNEISEFSKKLSNYITEKEIKPSLICGIGRGGGILGGLLSYDLSSIPLIVIDRIYEDSGSQKTVKIIFNKIEIQKAFNDLTQGTVLLVTPQSDPGITLGPCADFLKQSGFKHIVKCVILKSRKSLDTDIDIFIEEYEPTSRVRQFPWSVNKIDIMKKHKK